MNTFGNRFRLSIFGESHGAAVGITMDGCPSGIEVKEADFEVDLMRRQGGKKGTTTRKETDIPQIISGVFNGKTTGAPITILFKNENIRSKDYKESIAIPRPGHADFVLHKKFHGNNDYRGGGHSSGRLTVGLVAAGVLAKKIVKDIRIQSEIVEVGGLADIEKALEAAIKNGDSIGGVVACRVENLPIGLGEPFFNSVESLISHAVFSIPAIKAIEFGNGFEAARMTGSQHNDAIVDADGTTATNFSGGINGGITNGNELTFRVAVKPTSSTPAVQSSWNFEKNKQTDFRVKGRHDLCIALRMPVVLEAVAAVVIADLLLE